MNGEFVMIDIDVAEAAIEKMHFGDIINYEHPEDGKQQKVLLHKEAYYITVKGEKNKLAIPIQWTDFYKEEFQMRMPANSLGAPTGPKPRGRPPKKTGNAAPAEVRTNMGQQPMPPGQQYDNSFGSFPSPQAALQAAGVIPAQPTNPAAALAAAMQPAALRPTEQPTEMRIEQAENDPDWFRNSLEDAFNTFKEHLISATESAIEEALSDSAEDAPSGSYNPTPVPIAQKTYTCADCVYVGTDNSNGEKTFCSKFNILPPIFVAIAPEGKCQEFIADEEIPF